MKKRNISGFLAIILLLLFSAQGIGQKKTKARDTSGRKYTVLIALTHTDDYISIVPLVAKYGGEGHKIHFAVFTGFQDSTALPGGIKYKELQCAAGVLKMTEVFVNLGPAGENNAALKSLSQTAIDLINQTKPDVVITWGPDGLTGHLRHILVGNLFTRLFQQQSLLQHKPRKLYYIAYPERLFTDTRNPIGILASGSAGENFEAGPFGTLSDGFITTEIDGSKYLTQTRAAIACHTIPKKELNKQWQEEWYERLSTTLDGKVYLRLVFPVTNDKEQDIFKGL
jgi:LmbE family N-acetylglucosaminyl deacetylase